jgi:3-hydroxyisobutyrate dehydrogenase
MAMNLLKAGFPLTVFNRTRSKMDEAANAGATLADSPSEVAALSDVVITMVSDSAAVKEVILGPRGVMEGAAAGATVVDMSTISPDVTREIASELAEKQIRMLDAPVSGGESGAIAGTLSIMVGGEEDVFSECLPILRAMGKNIVHVGPWGAGQTVKLCNQAICALNILAVCEGLMLASRAGVNLEKMLEAVCAGSAASWMLSNQAPKMVRRDFEPGFLVRLQQKDMNLVLEVANSLDLPLPGTSLVNLLYRSVEAYGLKEKGTQSLIVALEKLSGWEVKESGLDERP